MKLFQLFFLILNLSFLTAQSNKGFYIEQKIQIINSENQSKPEKVQIWFSDVKLKIIQKDQEIFVRPDLKKVYIVFSKEKEYMELQLNQLDQFLTLSNIFTKIPADQVSFTQTGETEKIGEWESYKIKSETEKLEFTLWLTKEISFDRTILVDIYNKIPGLNSLAEFIEALKDLQGFPVKSEMTFNIMNNKFQIQSELLKISAQEIDSSIFNLPGKLKKIRNPFETNNN